MNTTNPSPALPPARILHGQLSARLVFGGFVYNQLWSLLLALCCILGAIPAAQAQTGTGLKADYFNNKTLTGSPVLSRTDATVNFQWQGASPGSPVPATNFSTRWTGQVQPQFSQSYTFYANTDDGVRLWVNGVQVINGWVDQAPTERNGTIALAGGQMYSITLEYYQAGGGSVAELRWSSSSTPKAIIPQNRLYLPSTGPATPSGLSATAISGTQVNLAWTDNSNNENIFKIQRKTGLGGTWAQIDIVGTNVTTYQNTGLTAGTTYYYRVLSNNTNGDSGTSNEANATTISTITAPSGLTATAVSNGQINLTWTDNSNNETGFKLERKTGSGGAYAQVATPGANITNYENTGLTAGTQYYYRLRATNASGDSAFSNEVNAATLSGGAPPNTPSGLTATAVSSSQINLSWTDNSNNENIFKIQRKIGVGGSWAQIDITLTNQATYQNTGLATGTTYYYRVLANNTNGDSPFSGEANATTQTGVVVPAAPSLLSQ